MFIVPIEKDNPRRNTPWVVYSLIFINTAVFLYSFPAFKHDLIVSQYGFIPTSFTLTTIFTSMFLHAGFMHILGNMFFLYMFGDNIEDVLGKVFFLVTYVTCGLGATGLHFLFNMDSTIPCVGASGAISGLVGLYMVLFPNAHVDIVLYFRFYTIKSFHTKAKGAIFAWFAMQATLGLLGTLFSDVPIFRIAFWAHVGGLLTGFAIGYLIKLFGFETPQPSKVVFIERKEEGKFWCPHCGKEEEFLNFGKYSCQVCDTKFHFAQEEEA